jgi:hypothetical protein
VSSVSWYILISNLMIGSIDPIFGIAAHVSVDNLILIDGRDEAGAV